MNGVVAIVVQAKVLLIVNITIIVPTNIIPWEIISKIALFIALKILSKSEVNSDKSLPS